MSVKWNARRDQGTHTPRPYLIIGIRTRLGVANILHFDDKSKYLPENSILMLTFAA